jgi:hypothetical protein
VRSRTSIDDILVLLRDLKSLRSKARINPEVMKLFGEKLARKERRLIDEFLTEKDVLLNYGPSSARTKIVWGPPND